MLGSSLGSAGTRVSRQLAVGSKYFQSSQAHLRNSTCIFVPVLKEKKGTLRMVLPSLVDHLARVEIGLKLLMFQ